MIEFFGLPGSGKSYLVERNKKDVQFTEVKVTKSERFYYGLIFCILHPIISSCFIGLILGDKDVKTFSLRKHLIMYIYMTRAAKYQKSKNIKKALIDEGLLMMFISITNIPSFLEDFLLRSSVFTNHKIFIIEASDEIRYLRMKKRGRYPRSGFFSNKNQKENLRSIEKNYKERSKKLIKLLPDCELICNN